MPDFFLVQPKISVDDVVTTLNLYYEQTLGSPSPSSCVGAEFAWRDNCMTELRAMLGNTARVESTKVTKVDGTTIPAWVGNYQEFVGTISQNAMVAQNAVLINLRNGAGLLDRPGRLFVSGAPVTALVDGVLDTFAYTALVDTFMATLMSIPSAGTPAWGGELRVRRTVIATVPQDPPVYVPVTSVDVTLELGTQQKRKGRLTGYQDLTP